MKYEPVVGIEVHAQLSTHSKTFCGCSTTFGAEPNTHGCPICLGMPGVLPVLNRQAVAFGIKLALTFGSEIQPECRFARKNYFYPDLPKGYQISQYAKPLALGGGVDIEVNGRTTRIRLIRIHIEEDAGKSIHAEDSGLVGESLVDVNRCGVPLLEIVSEPDLRSADEVQVYLTKLRQTLVYLDICDGNMEQGSMRMDVNVNMVYEKDGVTGKTAIFEIKNLNSFKNALRAIEAALHLQLEMLEEGKKISKETLIFHAATSKVSPMRSKEEAHDYRYFPEPDLVPVAPDKTWIESIREQLPELPDEKRRRFVNQYDIPVYDAEILTGVRALADYYEACVAFEVDPKSVSNWIMGNVLRTLKEQNSDIETFPVSPKHLADMIKLIDRKTITEKIARMVFEEMIRTGDAPEAIVHRKGLVQITDVDAIAQVVEEVLAAHPKEVARYREGKKELLGFFMGQVMRATKGKANPKLVNEALKEKLES